MISAVAPINAVLNWLLGTAMPLSRRIFSLIRLILVTVWGPKPIRLGFIGAPLATAISFNLVSLASIIYGVFYIPTTAWHPLNRRCFTNLGVLVQLGLAGVGEYIPLHS